MGIQNFFKNLPKADKMSEPKARRQFLLDQVEEIREEREPIVVTLLDASNNVFGLQIYLLPKFLFAYSITILPLHTIIHCGRIWLNHFYHFQLL